MTATTVLAERAGYTVLIGSATNIDGDQAQVFELPSAFGDAFLYEWQLEIASIATLVTPTLMSAYARMRYPSGAISDLAGIAELRLVSATQIGAAHDMRPRSLLWRTSESFELRFPEVDSNVSPTADSNVFFRVLRLRAP